MRIAVDIDEVLADTLNRFIAEYNKTYQTAFRREQFISYDWWEALGLTLEQFSERFLKFMAKGFFENLKTINGSVAAVKELKAKHELFAVTGRPRSLAAVTEEWLEKHYGPVFAGFYYTREVPFSPEFSSKLDICRKIGAKVLLEDFFQYAEDCAANGITVYLFDAPWNKNIPDRVNLIRVHAWTGLLKKLNG